MIKSIGTYKKVFFFCSEGVPYIAIAFFLTVVITAVAYCRPHGTLIAFAVAAWLMALEVGYFFRDPERIPPQEAGVIVAPADGTIIDIRSAHEERFVQGACTRVSIFMNIFNVHVNRAPIAGTISSMDYNPGKFLSAFKEKASLDNEQIGVGFIGRQNGKDVKILVNLIAGLIARRIVVWRDVGEQLARGERISLVKFGSRADVFLPAGIELTVNMGDQVKGGETVIGRFQ